MDVAVRGEPGREAPVKAPRRLPGLDPREYEHVLDSRSLDALARTPGMEALVTWFNRHAVERAFRIQYVGSNLKMTPGNLPEVHRVLKEVCGVLYLEPLPELYIQNSESEDAVTVGVERPLIVLSTSHVDALSLEELRFAIGREVGHIKSQHVLYGQIAMLLPVLGEALGVATLGVGSLVSTGLQLAILRWQRLSQYTADRAGLLACQDVETAIHVMMKQAGVPKKYAATVTVEAFIAQAREFEGFDASMGDRVVKVLSTMGQRRPWAVMRAAELLQWVEAGEYARILESAARGEAPPRRPEGDGPGRFCTACGARFSGEARFCTRCGAARSAVSIPSPPG